jgi:hypothetical protein
MKALWMIAALGVACGGKIEPIPGEPPVTGNPNPTNPEAKTSLWPMGTGSTWTYRITDPVRGVFEKTVSVQGTEQVPGTSTQATKFRSEQPHLEEISWQLSANGLVNRVREEDLKDGAVVRMTSWEPSTIKALAEPKAQGWMHSVEVLERVTEDGFTEEKMKTYVWRVVAVDQTVVAGAQTFNNALKVQRDRADKEGSERIYWLVPGVGKVREEGERTEELIRYDVK